LPVADRWPGSVQGLLSGEEGGRRAIARPVALSPDGSVPSLQAPSKCRARTWPCRRPTPVQARRPRTAEASVDSVAAVAVRARPLQTSFLGYDDLSSWSARTPAVPTDGNSEKSACTVPQQRIAGGRRVSSALPQATPVARPVTRPLSPGWRAFVGFPLETGGGPRPGAVPGARLNQVAVPLRPVRRRVVRARGSASESRAASAICPLTAPSFMPARPGRPTGRCQPGAAHRIKRNRPSIGRLCPHPVATPVLFFCVFFSLGRGRTRWAPVPPRAAVAPEQPCGPTVAMCHPLVPRTPVGECPW